MTVYLYPQLGVTTPFDPAHKHVTSPFLSAPVLAGVRLLIAFYTLVTLLVTLIWEGVRDDAAGSFFSYFTHLSYIGLCAYFFASGVQTFAFARSLRAAGGAVDATSYPLQRWPRFLQFLHVLLQGTITVFPIIVTVVFWVLLASPTIFDRIETAWSNISVHAINTAFALFEVLLTNIPLPRGFYVYTFLDPKKQGAVLAAYIFGIAAGYIIVFLLVRLLVVLRVRLVAQYCRIRAEEGRTSPEAFEEWEEIERPSKEVPTAV
ncbi:hypothetical protein LshimejAT787_0411220 [Lyophyllum shimeji]|uniref:Uncharacterized protein n=1 Tax=Lyophyllum shimeji TaxID=47721 RepID=A0A9P3PMK8_LYOSH|nr:hypothetical protein LshimejAT787_0411220 [Lyophyllum shimeji]